MLQGTGSEDAESGGSGEGGNGGSVGRHGEEDEELENVDVGMPREEEGVVNEISDESDGGDNSVQPQLPITRSWKRVRVDDDKEDSAEVTLASSLSTLAAQRKTDSVTVATVSKKFRSDEVMCLEPQAFEKMVKCV